MIKKYEEYLDGLRESGITNMWAAPSFLMKSFNMTENEAYKIFIEWKHSKEGK